MDVLNACAPLVRDQAGIQTDTNKSAKCGKTTKRWDGLRGFDAKKKQTSRGQYVRIAGSG